MLVLCVTSWQTYEPEWNVLYLWDYLDFISRLDVFVLAVILVYIAIVFSRDSYRCREAYRESRAHVCALTVDLKRRVRTLQSVAFTAPYFGLAGACLGLLESFRGVGMQKASAMAMVTTYSAASLLTTACGLIVALAAAGSSRYLLWLIEKLERRVDPHWRGLAKNSAAGLRLFPKYPLRGQFSKLPAFALIAAPGLAIVLAAFTSFASFRDAVGLELRLLQPGDSETSEHYRPQPVVIGISDRGAAVEPEIHLNSKKTTWDDLDDSVGNSLKNLPKPMVYVEADEAIPWADVAIVIDRVKSHSAEPEILLTIASKVASSPPHRRKK